MKGLLKVLLGGLYGYACYVAVLWAISRAAPRLRLSGDEIRRAMEWPLYSYQYVFPKSWSDNPSPEIMLTFMGVLMIGRGMYVMGKRAWLTPF